MKIIIIDDDLSWLHRQTARMMSDAIEAQRPELKPELPVPETLRSEIKRSQPPPLENIPEQQKPLPEQKNYITGKKLPRNKKSRH